MIDLDALTWALPGFRIQTDVMAELAGRVPGNRLQLWAPPAGWTSPAVEPVPAVAFALREAGWNPDDAQAAAARAAAGLLEVPVLSRPVLIDDYVVVRQGVSIAAVVAALATLGRTEHAVGDALARCGEHVGYAKLFYDQRFNCQYLANLHDFGAGPPPQGWTEAWYNLGAMLAGDELEARLRAGDGPALAYMELAKSRRPAWEDHPVAEPWFQEIMPEAAHIGAVLGQSILDRPGDEARNGVDYHGGLHRWLVLDFVCAVTPHSPFVGYLVEVADAPSVAALRAAFRLPFSYAPDFRLLDAFIDGLGVNPLALDLADFMGDATTPDRRLGGRA